MAAIVGAFLLWLFATGKYQRYADLVMFSASEK